MTENASTLSFRKIDPANGEPAKKAVFLLHGLGSNADDLISLAPLFAHSIPDAVFISPNAPFPCDMGPFGYQWFSLYNTSPEALYEGAETAAHHLNHFIKSQLTAHSLTEADTVLSGFSQGCMMSLHVGLRSAKPYAGILGYSGALLQHNTAAENTPISKPPVCLVHGVLDNVVPFAAMEHAKNILAAEGIDIETHARPMLAHSIDEEGIDAGRQFLEKAFS